MRKLIEIWKDFLNFLTPKKSSSKAKDILKRSNNRVEIIKAKIEELRKWIQKKRVLCKRLFLIYYTSTLYTKIIPIVHTPRNVANE